MIAGRRAGNRLFRSRHASDLESLPQDNSAINTRQVSDTVIQEVPDYCRLRSVRLCFAALVKTIRRGNS
jgi:hypothetical protein